MKNLFNIIILFSFFYVNAQDKIIQKYSKISFESLYLKSFQDVKAVNENVTVVLNTKTGEIACLALIKGFRFEVALMEEHFNENYIESTKFPKAIFRGFIGDFVLTKVVLEEKKYKLNGILELHGIKKEMNVVVSINKDMFNRINIKSSFFINNDDHNIIIPNIVKNKISDKISVKLECAFN